MADRTKHGSGRFAPKADAERVIRAARAYAGLTQAELGQLMLYPTERSGQNAVARIESGEADSYALYMHAAACLGLDSTEVIDWIPGGHSDAAPSKPA